MKSVVHLVLATLGVMRLPGFFFLFASCQLARSKSQTRPGCCFHLHRMRRCGVSVGPSHLCGTVPVGLSPLNVGAVGSFELCNLWRTSLSVPVLLSSLLLQSQHGFFTWLFFMCCFAFVPFVVTHTFFSRRCLWCTGSILLTSSVCGSCQEHQAILCHFASKLCNNGGKWRVQWRTIRVTDLADHSATVKACVEERGASTLTAGQYGMIFYVFHCTTIAHDQGYSTPLQISTIPAIRLRIVPAAPSTCGVS